MNGRLGFGRRPKLAGPVALSDPELHADAQFFLPGAITLSPDKATIEGTQLRLQNHEGRANLGAWDKDDERCHWLVYIREPGRYAVRGEFSAANGSTRVQAKLAQQTLIADVPRTRGWFQPAQVRLGSFEFAKPGVYQLTLAPASKHPWKPVNVWQLQLARSPEPE